MRLVDISENRIYSYLSIVSAVANTGVYDYYKSGAYRTNRIQLNQHRD